MKFKDYFKDKEVVFKGQDLNLRAVDGDCFDCQRNGFLVFEDGSNRLLVNRDKIACIKLYDKEEEEGSE